MMRMNILARKDANWRRLYAEFVMNFAEEFSITNRSNAFRYCASQTGCKALASYLESKGFLVSYYELPADDVPSPSWGLLFDTQNEKFVEYRLKFWDNDKTDQIES